MNRLIFIQVLTLVPMLALGHHSRAEYDFNVVTELQGEILNVTWRNPHIRLTLMTEDVDGTETIWQLEAQDVNSLNRRGVYGSLINVGDIVRVAGNLSTRRANAMGITNLLLPNGTEISISGNPAPRWSAERIGFEQTTAEQALADAGEGRGLFRVWMNDGPGGFPVQLPLTAAARAARAAREPQPGAASDAQRLLAGPEFRQALNQSAAVAGSVVIQYALGARSTWVQTRGRWSYSKRIAPASASLFMVYTTSRRRKPPAKPGSRREQR